ncbi:MAG: class I SAM-dependent methyltransferase [Sphingobacteriales bacterium]|uniref:class I SAM-dependent methyltransferase n=1 Tax=uncultured Dysgonomonas sp. TaxID=206096 RepID=UPI000966500C|nr:hypothetical protein [uncultured Dysgonomonas sp.]MBN8858108.1 class I SAM-dependent methyltransferase [Sphingobacteriales bacterium]OJY81028.1 MAG: hypothetical protein BGP14_07310 [Sphingobacteriales bacterium 44-15]
MKSILSRVKETIFRSKFDSKNYWETRYKAGGNSGSGSFGHLAEFKARTLNNFVELYQIKDVIEFGCGDGNQLTLAKYPSYIGLDVSITTLKSCIEKFKSDTTKSFYLYDGQVFNDNKGIFICDLALSIDVIFHLVEQEVYDKYLFNLFRTGKKYVIIYSSNFHMPPNRPDSHEYHRQFTKDIQNRFQNWKLKEIIKNEYPSKNYDDEKGSLADFYIYESTR